MDLTIRDATKILCTTEKQIYRWIDQGELPCIWVSDQPFFNGTELLEWATARRIPIAVSQFQDVEGKGKKLPSLVEALQIGGFHYRVSGENRESVLRSVVELLPLAENVDREMLFQVLLSREAAGSTGIGDGIAIPHVRHPLAINEGPASLSLCFLEQPIEFFAIDSQPVHTLFTMVSPTIGVHLQLLAKLSAALHNQAFKAAVWSRSPAKKILQEAARVEGCFPLASIDSP
jgi:PTS system nitrogen regulatory IIA component